MKYDSTWPTLSRRFWRLGASRIQFKFPPANVKYKALPIFTVIIEQHSQVAVIFFDKQPPYNSKFIY